MTERTLEERIEHDFAYHKPGSPGIASAHEQVREACRMAAAAFISLVPPGRELSLAITKLEEAMMWANAGIARNQQA